MRMTRQAARRTSPLLLSLILVVIVVVGFDGEGLLDDRGLVLVVGSGRGRLGLVGLAVLALLVLGAEAEEVALDVGALLRLGRPVVAGERDALRVLGALERFPDRDAGVLLVVAHDGD